MTKKLLLKQKKAQQSLIGLEMRQYDISLYDLHARMKHFASLNRSPHVSSHGQALALAPTVECLLLPLEGGSESPWCGIWMFLDGMGLMGLWLWHFQHGEYMGVSGSMGSPPPGWFISWKIPI